MLGLAVYLCAGICGTLFLLRIQIPKGLTEATSETWVRALSVMLVAGALLGMGGALRARWGLKSGLLIEALGAFLLAGMFTGYVLSIWTPTNPGAQRTWITIAFAGCLALGCLGRVVQAIAELISTRRFVARYVRSERR